MTISLEWIIMLGMTKMRKVAIRLKTGRRSYLFIIEKVTWMEFVLVLTVAADGLVSYLKDIKLK